jgi:hypothetical protein
MIGESLRSPLFYDVSLKRVSCRRNQHQVAELDIAVRDGQKVFKVPRRPRQGGCLQRWLGARSFDAQLPKSLGDLCVTGARFRRDDLAEQIAESAIVACVVRADEFSEELSVRHFQSFRHATAYDPVV